MSEAKEPREDEGRRPCVDVIGGRSEGKRVVLDKVRGYVIGRLPGAEIRINDPGVSRRHVRLTVHPDWTVEIADMRSTNGTILNGERIERAPMLEGDVLTLGPDAALRLCYREREELAQLDKPGPRSRPASAHAASNRRTQEPTLVIHRPKLEDLPLSARQLEVSRLVAAGLTNAAIAKELGISPRTVTSHLDHIYSRLSIGSRAALTRWIVERGLG